MNNGYNVVCKALSLSPSNTFKWTEEYAVFAQPNFTSGTPVTPTTKIMPIQSGQVTVLDSDGVFLTPTGNPWDGPFEINNASVPMCFGVICMTGDGLLPISLDFQPMGTGLEPFTPMLNLMVWFGRGLGTAVMFSTPVTRALEVVYTGTTSQSVSYAFDPTTGSGIWVDNSKMGAGLQYIQAILSY
ncbi:hypothetical protein BDZ94DRAFT_1302846 [Collybia nuda]|uniref:Uncharacterized protein n=1 Tax=Collybia nuda TaxID=64659 RepID=A0A9P5XQL8_9AGAR|nr:hypothetical protein BDZ94DRAFT_1302846 [Collybia nuda]